MKTILTLALLWAFVFSSYAQLHQKVVILPQSTIYLKGESNINDFTCELCNDEDTVSIELSFSKNKQQLQFESNRYALSIDKFVCDSKPVTRDLKKTLKMNKYPFMYLELERIDADKKVNLKITIAGNTNSYLLDYKQLTLSPNLIEVSVENMINVNDFEITPPTALLGLIQVKEMIAIKLNLLLCFEE